MRTSNQYRERAHQRHVVAVEAKLLSPDMSRCIDCVIRDISEGGALVTVRGEAVVPARVYLWQATAEAMVECEVRWNKLNLIGLKFLEEGAQAKLQVAIDPQMPVSASTALPRPVKAA